MKFLAVVKLPKRVWETRSSWPSSSPRTWRIQLVQSYFLCH